MSEGVKDEGRGKGSEPHPHLMSTEEIMALADVSGLRLAEIQQGLTTPTQPRLLAEIRLEVARTTAVLRASGDQITALASLSASSVAELRASRESADRSARSIARLTWALVFLTVVLVALTVVLVTRAFQ